jgi:5-methylcytosine-specific restriction endonuclease McrA
MASLGLVKLYEVEGKPFLELTNWWKHQPKYGRKTGEYKKWRMDVFLRDKFTCRVCGKVGGKLNAHHIKRYAQEPSLRTDLRNGITLCEDCHKEIHRKEGK